jgi:hypothetical protein
MCRHVIKSLIQVPVMMSFWYNPVESILLTIALVRNHV